MATFADAQLAAIRPPSGSAADHTPTVTLSVDYLAPVPSGAWLVLKAEILRTTRTLIFTQARVTLATQEGRDNQHERRVGGRHL